MILARPAPDGVPPGYGYEELAKDALPEAVAQSESVEISFRQFVTARWNSLQRYAFLLTGDYQVAEDVVQTALEKCWRRWDKIHADSPEHYVRVTVAHTAASRGRRRRVREAPLEQLVHPPTEPGDHAESQALRSGLWLGLNELPPRRRAVVVLRVWEDRSVAETARILGITTGAVKSQLNKALIQLRGNAQVRETIGTDGTPEAS